MRMYSILTLSYYILLFARSLQYSSSKLKALEILHQLCPHLTDEIILDRILPYIVYLWSCLSADSLRKLNLWINQL